MSGLGIRFVVIATAARGTLNEPELLDDANQWRAFSAWRTDESREERVAFEASEQVVWNPKFSNWRKYPPESEDSYVPASVAARAR